MKRLLLALAAALAAVLLQAFPAGASTAGASTATPGDVQGAVSTVAPAITCAVGPGNYCARAVFTSVNGGVRVTRTLTTGYTYGAGKGREWFRYSCTAGTCYTLPSATFYYQRADMQLNVTRTFAGTGMFLPCGNVFGVDYRNPAVNAPGPRALLWHVTCAANNMGTL